MRKWLMLLTFVAVLCAASGVARAAEPTVAESAPNGWAGPIVKLGAVIAAAVVVIGGALAIGRISAHAVESIARQPEAAAQMFMAWLLPAAMIEGAVLFAVVLCVLVI